MSCSRARKVREVEMAEVAHGVKILGGEAVGLETKQVMEYLIESSN